MPMSFMPDPDSISGDETVRQARVPAETQLAQERRRDALQWRAEVRHLFAELGLAWPVVTVDDRGTVRYADPEPINPCNPIQSVSDVGAAELLPTA